MLFWLGLLYCMGFYALKLLPQLRSFHVLNAESSSTWSVGILLLFLIFFCRYFMMIAPGSVIFALWVSMKGQVAGIVFKAARPAPGTILASKRVMAFYDFRRCYFSVIWASRGLLIVSRCYEKSSLQWFYFHVEYSLSFTRRWELSQRYKSRWKWTLEWRSSNVLSSDNRIEWRLPCFPYPSHLIKAISQSQNTVCTSRIGYKYVFPMDFFPALV